MYGCAFKLNTGNTIMGLLFKKRLFCRAVHMYVKTVMKQNHQETFPLTDLFKRYFIWLKEHNKIT